MVVAISLLKLAPPWWFGHESEEAALLAQLPRSPRLRRLLTDLDTLCMDEGFLHLSTDEIARRLRCSKATLYRLADSREELFELVIERWLARLRDAGWKEVEAATDWPGRLTRYLGSTVQQTWGISYEFMRDVRAFPGGHRRLMEHQQLRIRVLEAIIAGGIEAGQFSAVDPRLAADLILTTLRRALEPDFLASVGLSLNDAFEEWYRILEFGLILPKTAKGGTTRKSAPRKPKRQPAEGETPRTVGSTKQRLAKASPPARTRKTPPNTAPSD